MPTIKRQKGVAVVTALLLTTLAVTIVASLFWRQQVQVRSMENQKLQLQTQWVQRSLLDWVRAGLRDDARASQVDHLGEEWARPIQDASLDGFLGVESTEQDGIGSISNVTLDAQARYNLTNLAKNGKPDPGEIEVAKRLFNMISVAPELAIVTAKYIASSQTPTLGAQPANPLDLGAPNQTVTQKAPVVALTHVEDLQSLPGFSPATIEKLKKYVVILPVPTPVNANTTSAEVLAAVLGTGLSEAGPLIASRNHTYFKDTGDIANRRSGQQVPAGIDVKTHYFLAVSNIRLERASTQTEALISRKDTGGTSVLWIREL